MVKFLMPSWQILKGLDVNCGMHFLFSSSPALHLDHDLVPRREAKGRFMFMLTDSWGTGDEAYEEAQKEFVRPKG